MRAALRPGTPEEKQEQEQNAESLPAPPGTLPAPSISSDYARRVAIAIGLLKMLLQLQESRRTGALDVVGPAARVRFFVDEGLIVHADEGTVGETLGRILVRERVVDQEQYSAAIEWMTELRASGKKAMLGEVFVDLG